MNVARPEIGGQAGARAAVTFQKGGVAIHLRVGTLAQDELCVRHLQTGMQCRVVRSLYAMRWPQHLHAVGQFDQFVRLPSRMVGGKRNVIGRMPVLRQHDVLEQRRDALVGTALFLTWLAQTGMTMTQLRATYPAYYASKNKIELTPAIDVDKVLREIKERYADENVNDTDGVKIDFPENWVHLRKSNTEPIIRVYTEAKSMAAAEALAQRFIGEIKEICKI